MARTERRFLPASLTGMAAGACAACCLMPLLLGAGVLAGAGWAAAVRVLPGVAVVLIAAAGMAWWYADRSRRHATGCAGGTCSCG